MEIKKINIYKVAPALRTLWYPYCSFVSLNGGWSMTYVSIKWKFYMWWVSILSKKKELLLNYINIVFVKKRLTWEWREMGRNIIMILIKFKLQSVIHILSFCNESFRGKILHKSRCQWSSVAVEQCIIFKCVMLTSVT